MSKILYKDIEQASINMFNRRREEASREQGYNSVTARLDMMGEVEQRVGHRPYDWQLDAVEALRLGLDTVAIAPTGAGKTLPIAMLAFEAGRKVLVVSPLNALERDQVSEKL